MKNALIALAAAGAVLAGTPAAAEQMSINYKDLNLATTEGQQILEQRIDAAARRVCEIDRITTGSRIRSQEAQACYDEAKAAATKQVAALVSRNQLGG